MPATKAKKKEEYDRARRVERAISADGRPILEGIDYIPVLSTPGRKPFRIRVTDTGNVYATEVAE